MPDLPKCLAPAGGEPFLFRQLAWLAGQGARRVFLATGYRADLVENAVGDGARWGLEVVHSPEPEPLGTAGALRLLEERLEGPFFVLNGDTFAALRLDAMAEAHFGAVATATVALARRPTSIDCGAVTTDNEGWIRSFLEKPAPGRDASPERVNAGVYLFMPRVLAWIPAGGPASLERDVLPRLVEGGERVLGWPGVDRFWDIGAPERLAAFEAALAAGEV
ncbi:MAG: NTP transferase domain-containing protein [Candidatus Methylomirabilis sp.]|nr:NTP transferase domain-containing protein [Deltaproteobacteria bacterium]